MEIERNIPIPEAKVSDDKLTQRQIATAMSVGDSVLTDSYAHAHTLGAEIRRQKFKPVMRKQQNGKVRVWKTLPVDVPAKDDVRLQILQALKKLDW